MKKLIIGGLVVGLMSIGAGCSETEVEKVDGKVDKNTNTAEVSEKKDEKADYQEVKQAIANDQNVSISLAGIEKINNDVFGKQIKIKFEVENKGASTVTVQGREVSADNVMVDETLLSMSQDISPGKKAICILSIDEYEGYEFPVLENNLQMNLDVFDADTLETIKEYPVNVSLK